MIGDIGIIFQQMNLGEKIFESFEKFLLCNCYLNKFMLFIIEIESFWFSFSI